MALQGAATPYTAGRAVLHRSNIPRPGRPRQRNKEICLGKNSKFLTRVGNGATKTKAKLPNLVAKKRPSLVGLRP